SRLSGAPAKCSRGSTSGTSAKLARMASRRSSPCVGTIRGGLPAPMRRSASTHPARSLRFGLVELTAWEASVRIRRSFANLDLGGPMRRPWSALLGMAVAATLAGCSGGESKPGGDPPKPAPAAPAPQAATPTTVAPTGQAAEGEDDEPAPLLAWA